MTGTYYNQYKAYGDYLSKYASKGDSCLKNIPDPQGQGANMSTINATTRTILSKVEAMANSKDANGQVPYKGDRNNMLVVAITDTIPSTGFQQVDDKTFQVVSEEDVLIAMTLVGNDEKNGNHIFEASLHLGNKSLPLTAQWMLRRLHKRCSGQYRGSKSSKGTSNALADFLSAV